MAFERLRQSRNRCLALLAAVCLLMMPVFNSLGYVSNFQILSISLALIYSIAILGLVILTGYTGQVSLGHGAFFALGAYSSAILQNEYGWSYSVTLPVSGLVCFIAGYGFARPALRLKGHHLALVTFCLAVAVPQILKYRHLEGLTGGVQGIVLTKPEPPFGMPLTPDGYVYCIVATVMLCGFILARNFLVGDFGRALGAIRDQEIAATSMGIDVASYKTMAFALSAFFTGLAGVLYGFALEFVSPDGFGFDLSIALLVGAVVGGIYSLPGAIVGGAFVQIIDKYADAAAKSLSSAFDLPISIEPWTIYGLTLICLIFFLPDGVGGTLQKLTFKHPWSKQVDAGRVKALTGSS